MVWINGKAIWFLWPALTDVFVGRKASERFAPFGQIVGHQEGLAMCLEMLMGLIVRCPHRRFLERPVPAFHLTMRPGMVGCGQPMVNARLLADTRAEMMKRVSIALPVGAWATMIGEHGVDRGGSNGAAVAQAWGGDHLMGFCMPVGLGKCAGPVKGNTQGELPCVRADLRDSDLEVADRGCLEPLLLRLLAGDVREAAEAMPLQTAMERGSGQVRPCRLPRIEAVIERQQRVSTKGPDEDFFLPRSYRRVGLLRLHGGIMDVGAWLPRRHRLRVSIVVLG
jgi:hypothetical protein